MTGFTSSSARHTALLVVGLAACADQVPLPHATTSLRVTITDPTDLGTDASRLGTPLTKVTASVQALDERGAVDGAFAGPVDVYVHSLAALDPKKATLTMAAGKGQGTFTLPLSYGPTYLWIEDAATTGGRTPSYAAGISPTVWFREPFLEDTQRPDLGKSSTWLRASLLEGKQVKIASSRFGASGKLVVTGVYSSGFTLSDVDCTTKPCKTTPYGHGFAYSSSRPVDVSGHPVTVGQTIGYVTGGMSEFNGYTELNFPEERIAGLTPDETLVPDPILIQQAWLGDANAAEGQLKMEEIESALAAVDNVTVCALDTDYTRFGQWKVDIGLGCSNAVNVVTAGQVAGFDPAAYVGKKLKRVVGTVKGVNLPTFNVWILQPRRPSDLVIN